MPRFVAGKKLMSTPKTNQIIYDAIVAGKPFWAGRFGGTEMNMIYQQLLYRMHPEKASVETAVNQLCMLSGFFPNDLSLAEKFVDLMLQDCGQMGLYGRLYLCAIPTGHNAYAAFTFGTMEYVPASAK